MDFFKGFNFYLELDAFLKHIFTTARVVFLKENNLVMLFTTIIVMGSYLVMSDQPLPSRNHQAPP